jgi:hypothetical protein
VLEVIQYHSNLQFLTPSATGGRPPGYPTVVPSVTVRNRKYTKRQGLSCWK